MESLCRERGQRHGFDIVFRQSNHEGALVDAIQEAQRDAALGIVINAAAYTHTSVAIMDALAAGAVPVVEVHMTNIHRRETFRHRSFVSLAATGVLCGFGIEGYGLAIDALASMTRTTKS